MQKIEKAAECQRLEKADSLLDQVYLYQNVVEESGYVILYVQTGGYTEDIVSVVTQ